jgi:hypothetical protein
MLDGHVQGGRHLRREGGLAGTLTRPEEDGDALVFQFRGGEDTE